MSVTVVEGASQVRADVIGFVRDNLPGWLEAHRTLWGIDDELLPDPARYNEYEDEVVADVAPSIALSMGRSSNYRRGYIDPTVSTTYQPRYEMRLFAWLKAGAPSVPLADGGGDQQPNPSQRMRDRYAQVLTALLLDTPSLGKPGIYRLDEGSLTVDYSAASRLKGDRYLSGVSVSFDLQHTETLRRVPLGSTETVTVEATVQLGTDD